MANSKNKRSYPSAKYFNEGVFETEFLDKISLLKQIKELKTSPKALERIYNLFDKTNKF